MQSEPDSTENNHPDVASDASADMLARECLQRCDRISALTETEGVITRRYLSPPIKDAHQVISTWMRDLGMSVRIDDAGNLVGRRKGTGSELPVVILGSHLDTVPNGGRYDGLLGFLMSLSVVRGLGSASLPFDIDVIGFSEEEGVRFSRPYLGSRAITGSFEEQWLNRVDEDGVSLRDAIGAFGLNPDRISASAYPIDRVAAFIEPHIEQGPVLTESGHPVAVVDSIVGQSRLRLRFDGHANHAGTTPMSMRRDALVTASRWVTEVSDFAKSTTDLRATVGFVDVKPNARNAIPGRVEVSLDVRHASDPVRESSVEELCRLAQRYSDEDEIGFSIIDHQTQPAVLMDPGLIDGLRKSAVCCGIEPKIMTSGAGHDAVAMASVFPTAMLFIRQPKALSHHPDEDVTFEGVSAGIAVLLDFVSGFLS